MAAPTPRNVTPIIAKIRDLMNGRKLKNHQRFEQLYSPRSLPKAALPYGVSHHLAANYYYTRDGRRESMPPAEAYGGDRKVLESGQEETEQKTVPTVKTPTPGLAAFNWDM